MIHARFFLALTFAAVTAQAALTDGLVSHWTLNEITAQNTAADAHGQNHLDIVGAPTVGPGQDGNAFTFINPTTYLLRRHDPDRTIAGGLPIYTAGAYSISMWVKGTNQTARYLFAHGSTNSNTPLFILQTGQAAANNAKFDVIIRNNENTALVNHVVSDAVVFDDTWHHIAWVDDNGSARVYIDGNLDIANFNYTPAGTFTFNTTAIGTLVRAAISTAAIFNGSIDDVRIWERALTQDEVYDLLPDVAPAITAHPASVTRATGDWALFNVTHSGYGPFTYQWLKNGEEIPGATAKQYRVSGLTAANTGERYSVRVTNTAGSATSNEATLTVNADPASDIRKDLVNYWPLDAIDSDGTLLTSEDLYSGNAMVLMGFTAPTDVVPGKFANALDFDGARYTYRTNGAPVYSSTNYSVSLWVRGDFTGQNDRRVYSEGSTTDADPLFTLGTQGAGTAPTATVFIRSDTGGATAVNGRPSTRPAFDNEWHHLVWTDANGQGKLYIDGILDETDYTYTRPTLTLNTTSLGGVLRAAIGNQFLGAIDEVATWKRVLTWTEIQEIMTNGVPKPISIIAPGITTQPLNRTSGVFNGDTVTFNVQTSGTVPLTYEWFRNGVKIDPAVNGSAATDTLQLNNVAVADSGSTFYVKVTNPAGSVQSDTVTLNVAPYTPATSGEVLHIDVGLSGSPNVQPGFDEFTLAMNGTNYNGVGVTISGIGAALAERNRTTGAMVTNNPPTMTQAQIYNDFVFASSTTDGTGLRILIERLAPSTPYAVTIWSFDAASAGARFADWSETSGAEPVVLQAGYTFDGAVLPVNDNDQTITATLTSSPTGKLQIDAIKNGGTSFGAFVNAIRLVANPSANPGVNISGATLTADKIRITARRNSTDQTVTLEERADLLTGAWAPSAATVTLNGLDVTFEAPASSAKMFFRLVSQ